MRTPARILSGHRGPRCAHGSGGSVRRGTGAAGAPRELPARERMRSPVPEYHERHGGRVEELLESRPGGTQRSAGPAFVLSPT